MDEWDERDREELHVPGLWVVAGLWSWAILGAVILGLVLAARALGGLL